MKFLKFIFWERFNKSIDYLLIYKDIFENNNINVNLFAYVIIFNIDIFNIYIKLKIFN